MAGVQPGDRVLEIGCGWGALAEAAACEFGARVTGVTLSTEQLAFAQQRMARAGWPTGPTCGCRTTATSPTGPSTPSAPSRCSRPWAANTGRSFFATVRGAAQARRPGLHPEHHDRRRAVRRATSSRTDFIQQYIFPGGCLPSPARIPPAGRGRGPASGRRIRLRRRLRRDAAPLARALPGAARARAATRLRRALHAHLGVLPGLLRSGLRQRQHRRHAVHACESVDGGRPARRRRAVLARPTRLSHRLAAVAGRAARQRGWRAGARCAGGGWRSTTPAVGRTGLRRRDFAAQRLALELAYRRPLRAGDIARRSLEEMRRTGMRDAAQAAALAQQMRTVLPDVDAGDRITGVHRPGRGARFFVNGRPAGEVRDAEFTRLFFGIWLAPGTSEPALREALLGGTRRHESAARGGRLALRPAGAAAGLRGAAAVRGAAQPLRARTSACRWPALGAVLLLAPAARRGASTRGSAARPSGCFARSPPPCWAPARRPPRSWCWASRAVLPAGARHGRAAGLGGALAAHHLRRATACCQRRRTSPGARGWAATKPQRGAHRRLARGARRWPACCWRPCCPRSPAGPRRRLAGRGPGRGLLGLAHGAGVRCRQAGAAARAAWWMPFRHGPRSAAAGACSWSTASPAPSRPRWCCSSSGPAAGAARLRAAVPGRATSCARPLSMPLWLRAVPRFGLARSWLAGMLLAIAVFVWAACWARVTCSPSWRSACCRGSRWAPTWRCPARCWPA